MIDGADAIVATCTAPDPPWANNGPTSIRPDFWKDKRSAALQKKSPPEPEDLLPMKRVLKRAAAPEQGGDLEAYLDSLRKPQYEEVEVTQAVKQRDMPLIPHPFIGNDLTGLRVVLLEPVGALCECLSALHAGEESIADLLHNGYLILDNDPLDLAAPPGVIPVRFRWKST